MLQVRTGAGLRVPAWLTTVAAIVAVMFGGVSAAPARTTPVPAADASLPEAENALAQRFAPVLRVQPQETECGSGERYRPIDVTAVFANPEVALRGPWTGQNLVKVAPGVADLNARRAGYSLDFPGSALKPGCTYEQWTRRLLADSTPTVYARSAVDPDVPGTLSLQYWMFWPYNDWENKHEGDWEMIQLRFDAPDAARALAAEPVVVGYSQHAMAEKASWDDPKLERVDGTHPVVYPATGSHANYFASDLFVGRGGKEGMGCDSTRDASSELRPRVRVIPSDPEAAVRAYPWLAFPGHWGERHGAFYDGPTGPAFKTQWTHPMTWESTRWRASALTFPSGGAMGTTATGVFCATVSTGSRAARVVMTNPEVALIGVGAVVIALIWLSSRTHWRPSAPLRVARRRRLGQMITAAGRMVARRPATFFGIGVVALPLGALGSLSQWILEPVIQAAPWFLGVLLSTALLIEGAFLGALGVVFVACASAMAMVRVDRGEGAPPWAVVMRALRRLPALCGALTLVLVSQVLLDGTIVLLPLGVYLLARWALFASVIGVEGGTSVSALRRSWELTRGNTWRVLVVLLGAVGLTAALGPMLGVMALVATGWPFAMVNLLAGIVYVATIPVAAVMVNYLYFDLRARHVRGAEGVPSEPLPAEFALSPEA